MGDGQVLESGTHDDLLRREAHYHRLVQAQKLRESVTTTDTASEHSDKKEEGTPQEDVPLTRKSTGRSLASEIIEQKRKDSEPAAKDIGLFTLASRLLPLIRDKQMSYILGTFFACCECFFLRFNPFSPPYRLRGCLSCFWCGLREGYGGLLAHRSS